MSKKACDKDSYTAPKDPQYICKKCKLKAKKKSKLCKPKEINE